MSGVLIYKIIVVLLLFAVIISLTSGMFFLVHDKGESDRTVKSLTIRISLSIALFLMLIIGYFTGMIQPHGIEPTAPETKRALPE
ncbi:MAG: twin transmembrane helix small protein [Gammaproteobacteria bacterium]